MGGSCICNPKKSNKFGALYVIARIILFVCIIVLLVRTVIGLINYHTVDNILWAVFAILSLLLGLLANWREHFLCMVIFAIIELVLAMVGFVGSTSLAALATVLCLVCSIGLSIMLYLSGSRETNMPQIC